MLKFGLNFVYLKVISPLCNWMHGPDTLLVSGDVVAASAVSTGEYHTANPAQRTAAAPSSWSVLHGHSCGPSARPQGYFVQSKSITGSESIQWNVWASKVKNSMSVELTVLVMRMFIFTAKCFQQAKAPNIRWVVKDPAARLWQQKSSPAKEDLIPASRSIKGTVRQNSGSMTRIGRSLETDPATTRIRKVAGMIWIW